MKYEVSKKKKKSIKSGKKGYLRQEVPHYFLIILEQSFAKLELFERLRLPHNEYVKADSRNYGGDDMRYGLVL